jgi:hypoxanthine phosphoribosyltransferase
LWSKTTNLIQVQDPLISAAEIHARVAELGRQITDDCKDMELPLSVIVVLKGAVFFAIDLLKEMHLRMRIDFLQASSYEGMGSSGEVTLHKDINMAIGGTDVLLIEDIVDTGLTASWLRRHLSSHNPRSVRLVTLLDKPERRIIPVEINYTGFVIPDAFVLGYGLDFDEEYRNLPAVYVASTAQ